MFNLKGKNQVISIMLPFKNEEKYLKPCIESIIAQTYPYWELLLVDDHSSDRSTEIAQTFAQQDARIIYLKNKGFGVIEALKLAHKHSTGSLLTRMDGDDLKTPDNLQQLLDCVKPEVLAVGRVKYFREDGLGMGYLQYEEWINKLTASHSNFSEVYKECVIPSPCWLAYRNDFEKAGGFNSDFYPEDYDLCFRFYEVGLKTIGTEGVIHLWRDHAIRTTRVSEYYSDNRFLHLKLFYFFKIDFEPTKNLVLWGAGKKGKQVAKDFIEKGLAFRWLTDNPNKIGHNIYGIILESINNFTPDEKQQIVIAVSDKKGQDEIKSITQNGAAEIFWFC
ncbi:MAG: glycosyltransferase family 2 protein [Flavobacteriales bacterium]|nr:glycosyltransferase family 2 protein [Flavobacteriales bacterium]